MTPAGGTKQDRETHFRSSPGVWISLLTTPAGYNLYSCWLSHETSGDLPKGEIRKSNEVLRMWPQNEIQLNAIITSSEKKHIYTTLYCYELCLRVWNTFFSSETFQLISNIIWHCLLRGDENILFSWWRISRRWVALMKPKSFTIVLSYSVEFSVVVPAHLFIKKKNTWNDVEKILWNIFSLNEETIHFFHKVKLGTEFENVKQ